MVYADYDYYTKTYLGTALNENDFPRLALRASEYIDRYTRNRAAAMAEAEPVKKACCALSEQMQLIEQADALARSSLAQNGGAELERETVGAYSVSYRDLGGSAASARSVSDGAERALADLIRRLLAGTGLCYRGGGRG